ncbi:MAG: ABC transporter permease [Clostridia bacterium]|nr:ABC transporter permease [Clostridia bacterium]
MITLIRRTLKIHLRNRSGILFSLLSVFLVLLICVVFMQDNMVDSVMQRAPAAPKDSVVWLMACWVMAGLVSITPITTSCGTLVYMVGDRTNKIIKDFKSAPLRKFDYPLAMVLSSVIFSFLITVLLYAGYGIYVCASTGHWFDMGQWVSGLAVILLTSVVSACVNGCLLCRCESLSAYSSYSTVLGTTIGFFNGIYVPLGALPLVVRRVVQFFPFGGASASLRSALCRDALTAVFEGAGQDVVAAFRDYFGIDYVIGGTVISHPVMLVYMTAFGLIGFILFMKWFGSKQEEY